MSPVGFWEAENEASCEGVGGGLTLWVNIAIGRQKLVQSLLRLT